LTKHKPVRIIGYFAKKLDVSLVTRLIDCSGQFFECGFLFWLTSEAIRMK
jgi:hypothetical protein